MTELIIEAKPENLHPVFDFVLGEAGKSIPDQRFLRQIKLCTEEIYLNIANYAYYPDSGQAVVGVALVEEPQQIRVQLCFSDSGKPFDPLQAKAPDLQCEPSERQVGGLGIFMVRELADEISYEYKDGRNVLKMEKVYKKQGEEK